MQMQLKMLLITLILIIFQSAYANNIYVENFQELIDSGNQSVSGDTITIVNDITSDDSIGNSFYTKDVTFQGQNFNIDGSDAFGGFVLSQGSNFNRLRIINCKGQIYNNSYFAGAIFNNGGNTIINNSAFNNNYANASGFNFAVAGAVYNLNNGTISINSSLFDNNYAIGASAQGGALGNDSGLNTINISDSVFNDNYTHGSAISYGGAITNGNNATININNSLFNNNFATTASDGVYLYGGSIYNTGTMNIDNSYFSNNHILGNADSFAYGGAIHNNSNLTITNTIFNNNYISSDVDSSGGAIYNYLNGNITISNSTFENNSLDAQNSRGGAIGNEGILTIINSNFKNNTDSNGENDIFTINTVNFEGEGTTNILSGIRGSGNIFKYGNGVLNLGGNNSNFTGTFDLDAGTVNILPNSEYFNAKLTGLYNGVNFNMQNGQIDNINFSITSLYGQSNIYPDVNFYSNSMDTISASSVTGTGNIFIPRLAIYGVPQADFISIPFANSLLKNYVNYNSAIIQTPIYDYLSSYNSSNGNFNFSRRGFNPGILSSQVATQLAGFLVLIDTFNNVFSNLDMVMVGDENTKKAINFYNKFAYNSREPFGFVSPLIPEQNSGIWFKPYSVFENVPLKNGPVVSNVGYGGLFGGESGLIPLKKGWRWLYGGYASYNGSHQAYDGIGIYNNGGLIGALCAFYKEKFFSLWSLNVGANSAKTHTDFGMDNFSILSAGFAQKSGFNFPLLNNKLIIQPNIMSAYTFVNTFNYANSAGVDIYTKPLNVIHIEPQIKIIGNFKNLLQPYLAVSVAWNIMDKTKFKANDVYLPELSVKPYVRYGVGIQKRIADSFVGFLQAYITNGGRNGVGLYFGLRWSFGKKQNKGNKYYGGSVPEKPKAKILLSGIK